VHKLLPLPVAVTVLFFVSATPVHAYSLNQIAERHISSRQVTRTAEYLRSLDRNDLLQNERRQRITDAPPDVQGRLLREPMVRLLKSAKTDPAIINRQRNFLSPTVSTRSKKSTTSTVPVSIETESFYRNGVKYLKGDGMDVDLPYAYMWFSFALADGHPLARMALVEVSKKMNPSQLAQAQVRTDVLATKFLKYRDNREAKIRDDVRERDMKMLFDAIIRYRESRAVYPAVLARGDVGSEICRLTAATCVYRLDMMGLVPTFILRIPADPLLPVDGNGTGYFALLDDEYRFTLFAGYSETKFIILKEER
jgi:hypothetical protein